MILKVVVPGNVTHPVMTPSIQSVRVFAMEQITVLVNLKQ
jgi:hypothetical protein